MLARRKLDSFLRPLVFTEPVIFHILRVKGLPRGGDLLSLVSGVGEKEMIWRLKAITHSAIFFKYRYQIDPLERSCFSSKYISLVVSGFR